MISSKLGLHIIGGTSLALGRPRVVKLVDPSVAYVRQVRALVGPNCLIVVRWVESSLLDRGADVWFFRHLAQMQAMSAGDSQVCFESANEIADSDAPRYGVWELARMRLMHTHGLRSVLGNWSVGVPDLPVWQMYGPLLNEMRPGVDGDLVGLHEYWSDYADIANRWHCGRWALVPQLAGKPIVITECGRDVVEGHGKPGWQLTCDGPTYLADLRAYSRLLDSAPNVVGATVYQVGAIDPQWKPFAVDSIWGTVVGEYSEGGIAMPDETIKLVYPIRGPVFVTQEFGEHAVNYAPYPGHPGQDLRAEIGHPIRAAHDGIVYHDDSYGPDFGTYCWVRGEKDGKVWWAMYNHLLRVLADDKEPVKQGNIIALSGNSGTSTSGAHLDWRIETTVPNPGYQDRLDPRYYWHDVREFLGQE